jgi:uncharacterized membrane protein YtjA (UPF0391 family)
LGHGRSVLELRGAEDGQKRNDPMKDLKLVVSVIASVFGIILLVVAHDPGLAAILFVIGAVLALYSLLDWLTAGKRFK